MSDFEELEDSEVWKCLKTETGVVKARVLYELSKRSYIKNDYKSALVMAELSKDLYLANKEESTLIEIADAYFAIAVNKKELNEHDQVVINVNFAKDYYQKAGLPYNILASELLIDALENLEKHEDVINELNKLIEFIQIDEMNADIVFYLIKLCENLKKLGKFDESLTNAEKAFQLSKLKKSENQSIYIQALIAEIYFEKKDYDKSLKMFIKIESIFELLNKEFQEIKARFFIAKIYNIIKNYNLAKRELEIIQNKIKLYKIEDNDFIIKVEEELIKCLSLVNANSNSENVGFRTKRLNNYYEVVGNEKIKLKRVE